MIRNRLIHRFLPLTPTSFTAISVDCFLNRKLKYTSQCGIQPIALKIVKSRTLGGGGGGAQWLTHLKYIVSIEIVFRLLDFKATQ